jgi:hypothetical protein
MGQKGESAAAGRRGLWMPRLFYLRIVVGRAALGFGFGRRISPFLSCIFLEIFFFQLGLVPFPLLT